MRRRFSGTFDHLAAAMTGLIVAGVLVSSLATVNVYREVVAQTRRVATNLTLTVERDFGRDLYLVDLSIQGVIQALRLQQLDTASPAIRHAALFGASMNQDEFGTFVVLSRDGLATDISGSRTLPSLDFSDREYFRQHQASPSLESFVGPVILGRLDGQRSITLSRRIPTDDGSFAGVVVGTVHLSFLRHAFDRLDLGSHGSITLVQDDGTIILRDPEVTSRFVLTPHMRLTYQEAARKPAGFGIAVGPDGVYRYYAYHRVSNLPMFVVVGFSVREVLEPWLQKFAIAGSLTALLCVAAFLLTRALDRELKRRRGAEERLLSFNQELEARVAREVAAREEAQDRLVAGQRLEALGQLAGGVAHDFNNVLQAVSSANSLLARETGARHQRLTGMIAEAADRGASVARRLLVFARQSEFKVEVIDVARLVLSLKDLLIHTLGSGIEIKVDADADLAPVLVDRVQLETVLVNLATNARDAMSTNGGTLSIEARSARSQRRLSWKVARNLEDMVCIVVSDTGCGMPAIIQARATEPFFTTKPAGQGTGLGLAMANGFAEQSGGEMTIASEVGKGTIVVLWLPQCDAAAQPQSMQLANHMLSGTSERARILLVDDDPIVRQLLAEQLEELGFRVTQAFDATSALGMVAIPPDVLVTDLSMPGMDGLALITELHRRHPTVPAILVTGYAGDPTSTVRRGAARGDFMLLQKPLRTAQLVDYISISLRGSRSDIARQHVPAEPEMPKPPQAAQPVVLASTTILTAPASTMP